MKRVYRADNLVDGKLVADWLGGNGIGCEIFHQNGVAALGELPVTPPEVWVRRDSDAERAIQLVEQVIFADQEGERVCRRCGEENPASFDICWHCRYAMDSPTDLPG